MENERNEREKRLDEEFPYARDAESRLHPPRENPTCLRAAGDVFRAFKCNMRRRESNEELHDSYRPLLRHLARFDGCSQMELVHATRLRAPTVSVTLAKMERDGLVTRRNDDYDLRSRRVYITDKGRRVNTHIREAIDELERRVMQGVGEQDAAVTLRTLEKMFENLRGEPDDRKKTAGGK